MVTVCVHIHPSPPLLLPPPPQIKYEKWLFKICSEGDGDATVLSKLKNRGVDFNEFDNVSPNIIITL